jgi:hypothetical protein
VAFLGLERLGGRHLNIETTSHTAQFRKALDGLLKREVLVGIPASNAARDPEPGESPAATNALIGYVHEYGSPAKNIPARPFLHPGIADARADIEVHMKKAGQMALAGKMDEISQELEKVGLIAQVSVQRKITEGPFEPLAPATLAARRARGRTGTNPLLDTGQLRRAISYIVR